MDRRNFLKNIGVVTAGVSIAAMTASPLTARTKPQIEPEPGLTDRQIAQINGEIKHMEEWPSRDKYGRATLDIIKEYQQMLTGVRGWPHEDLPVSFIGDWVRRPALRNSYNQHFGEPGNARRAPAPGDV